MKNTFMNSTAERGRGGSLFLSKVKRDCEKKGRSSVFLNMTYKRIPVMIAILEVFGPFQIFIFNTGFDSNQNLTLHPHPLPLPPPIKKNRPLHSALATNNTAPSKYDAGVVKSAKVLEP